MSISKKRALEIFEKDLDIIQKRLNDTTIHRRKSEKEKMLEKKQALEYIISLIKRSKHK